MTEGERVELALRRAAAGLGQHPMHLEEFIQLFISELTHVNNYNGYGREELLRRRDDKTV